MADASQIYYATAALGALLVLLNFRLALAELAYILGLWEYSAAGGQTVPRLPLHQLGVRPIDANVDSLYAVWTSSNSHNCCAGKGNRP